MSKIVRALNVMIQKSENIDSVNKKGEIVYWLYKDRYVWSIFENPSGEINIRYFPDYENVGELFRDIDIEVPDINVVTYSTIEFKTKEAQETFTALYTLVKEKVYGVDEVIDDILEDEESF